MGSIRSKLLRVLACGLLLYQASPVESAVAFSCSDVHIVWARGANSVAGGFDFRSFVENELLRRIHAPVTTSAYQLGNGGYNGHEYQPGDFVSLIQNGLGGGGPYRLTVATGLDEFVPYLTDRAAQCGNEVYVLGSWSEGAEVLGSGLQFLPQSVRDRIAFVALFGDPSFETGNWLWPLIYPLTPFPPGCRFAKPWIRGNADCGAAGGIFGSRTPYVPSDMEQRVGSWCRDHDAACTGFVPDIPGSVLVDPHTHEQYFADNPDSDSAQAAREAAERLKTFVPANAGSFDATWDQFVDGQVGADLAIVFDTTGSMAGSIANAKAQATQLANQWTSLFDNGRVGLVDFKDVDQGDPYAARLDLNLTNDASAFQAAVNTLSASGGGDTPEAQLSGIMSALDGMTWANGATKAVVVITDATGKDPEPVTNFTRASVDQHALEIDPVAIYGVNVSALQAVADWMTPMAGATGGEVVTLAPGQSLSDALSNLFESVHAAPVARLRSPYIAQTGTAIRFDASGSFDASAVITSYRWDFNGDAVVDRTTTSATTDYTYPADFHGLASVEVVADDGRSSFATADVSVDQVGLTNVMAVAPVSAGATVSGASQVTVTWTPAANDRADAYKVYLPDGRLARFALAADPHSLVIDGVDLSQPVQFRVVSSNVHGDSAAVLPPIVGGTAWSQSVKVNDDSGSAQQDRPATALGADGAAYLIWDDYRPGTQADIYFSRRDPATGTWSANQRVNNDTSNRTQYQADIAVDGANTAYAVWQDPRNGSKTPDPDIYFSKRPAGTGTWAANVRVNGDTQGAPAQYAPAISVKSDGAAVAVWVDRRSNQWNIYSARLAAGASTWGTNLRVTSNTASRKDRPDVVVGPDGSAFAVWEDDRNGNYDIWYATLPAGSSTWSTNTKISDDPGSSAQYGARIGIDSAGNLLVIWLDDRPYPRTEVRASRLPSGSSSWTSSVVASDAPAYAGSAALSVRSNGNGFAVWEDARGSSWDIWGAGFDAAAGTWGAAALVSDDPGTSAQRTPTVAIDGAQIVAAWRDHRADTVQGDIFARRRTSP